ncbi:hypothetical protein AMST5_01292 [freshwater sediment metagenome]|uniref:Uncharacterized protein n=1 Tax=freshwater sediment metagenome TaxID=556182 RepID=A0AA48LZT5_9ZZZZ
MDLLRAQRIRAAESKILVGRAGGKSPMPKTVAEALERAPVELRKIVGIDVRTIGKYPEVIKLHFGEGVNEQPAAAPKRTTTNAA